MEVLLQVMDELDDLLFMLRRRLYLWPATPRGPAIWPVPDRPQPDRP